MSQSERHHQPDCLGLRPACEFGSQGGCPCPREASLRYEFRDGRQITVCVHHDTLAYRRVATKVVRLADGEVIKQ